MFFAGAGLTPPLPVFWGVFVALWVFCFIYCFLLFVLLLLYLLLLLLFPCIFCVFYFGSFFLSCCCSVAMVVLSGFSFAVVVISLSSSKTCLSFHAAIKCLSSAATSGEGRAEDEDEVCSFVFLFWFGICLCSALYCAHVVRWAASSKVFG
jgi:hypothetical protein